MSTESESNISTIWDIFMVEICLEALGGKLSSKSRWGKDEKRGGNYLVGGGGGEYAGTYGAILMNYLSCVKIIIIG